jgi:hypothetical protein
MKVENLTHWRTDHLRAFVVRVAAEELDPEVRRHYRVVFGYNRQRGKGGGVSGYAYYGGRTAHVNVPSDEVDRVNLAHTIAHEMAHSRGMRHRAMRGSRRYTYAEGWRGFYSWAEAMPLERKALPPSLTVNDRARRKHMTAEFAAARWRRKANLAKTMLRKWERRLRRLKARIKRMEAS